MSHTYGTIKPSCRAAINKVDKLFTALFNRFFFANVCLQSNLQSSFDIQLSVELLLASP